MNRQLFIVIIVISLILCSQVRSESELEQKIAKIESTIREEFRSSALTAYQTQKKQLVEKLEAALNREKELAIEAGDLVATLAWQEALQKFENNDDVPVSSDFDESKHPEKLLSYMRVFEEELSKILAVRNKQAKFLAGKWDQKLNELQIELTKNNELAAAMRIKQIRDGGAGTPDALLAGIKSADEVKIEDFVKSISTGRLYGWSREGLDVKKKLKLYLAEPYDDFVSVTVKVSVWAALRSNGSLISNLIKFPEGGLTDIVAYDVTGNSLAAASKTGKLYAFLPVNISPAPEGGKFVDITTTPSNKNVVAVKDDGTVSLWCSEAGKEEERILRPLLSGLTGIKSVTRYAGLIAFLGSDGSSMIFRINGKEIMPMELPKLSRLEGTIWLTDPGKVGKMRNGKVGGFKVPKIVRDSTCTEVRDGEGAYAVRLADRSWQAWTEHKNDFHTTLCEKINNIGPAVDLTIFSPSSDKRNGWLLWIK